MQLKEWGGFVNRSKLSISPLFAGAVDAGIYTLQFIIFPPNPIKKAAALPKWRVFVMKMKAIFSVINKK